MAPMMFIYEKIQTILKEFDLDTNVKNEIEDWYLEFWINGYNHSYFRIYLSVSGDIILTDQNQINIGSYNPSDNYYNKLAEDLMIYLINI